VAVTDAAKPLGPVVVGVDDSETARKAAARAAELAQATGRQLHIVTGVKRGGAKEVVVSGSERILVDWVSSAEQTLASLITRLSVTATTAVVVGDPAHAVCEEAERVGADIIVVGNRRVQGVSRVLGSIALDIVRHAPCDVYIAHTT
jgi:nucleotide-binding universal stress UspA family protein